MSQEQAWDSLPTIEVTGQDEFDKWPTVEVIPPKKALAPLPTPAPVMASPKPSMADQAIQSRMMGVSGAGLKEAPKVFGDYLQPLTTSDYWMTTGKNFLKQGWDFVKSTPEFVRGLTPQGWAENLGKRLAFAQAPQTKEEAKKFVSESASPLKSIADLALWLPKTALTVIQDPIQALKEKPFDVVMLATSLFGPKATGKLRAKLKANVGLTATDLEEAFAASGSKLSDLITAQADPVQKIITAVKEAKPLRKEQASLFTKERAIRFARAKEIGQETSGMAGFHAEKGALAGELPKVQWESIASRFNESEVVDLVDRIKNHPRLTYTDTLTAREGLEKLLGEKGFGVPTESELLMLNKVYGPEFAKTILSKRPAWQRIKAEIWEAANIPRAMMATLDLSAPLRQGVFMVGRKEFYNSFASMFKYFGSEKVYQALLDDIAKRPNYELMRKSRLALTELDVPMTMREEVIMSHLPEKIPVIGKAIRGSNRAYTGFLNKLRADVFDNLTKKAEGLGLDPKNNTGLTGDIANFVNAGTGRGTLWGFERHAVGLNSLFFSPRLMGSRLNLLNPHYYIKLDPFVRKEALKSLMTFAGAGVTMLGIAKLSGAEVGANPLSADFGKIKIGHTRIDMWGGFQQYIRTASQLVAGKTVSAVSGKETILGAGYKPKTRLDVAGQAVESKMAPILSFTIDLLRGSNYAGNKINIPTEIASRFIPMVMQDLVDIAKDNPDLIPLSVLGIFGAGLQTYKPNKKKGIF